MSPRIPNPVSSPFVAISSVLSMTEIYLIIGALVLAVWAIYTAILIYHWTKYEKTTVFSTPVLTAHLGVSLFLLLLGSSGFIFNF